MRYCYKVYKRIIMEKNTKKRLGGTRKFQKVSKEKTVPPMELKNPQIEPSELVKEKMITWKVNLKISIQPASTDNPRSQKKQSIGC